MTENIERHRGDLHADEFQILSETTGLALDINGMTFVLTVDPSENPANASANVMALTGAITDASNGLVEFAPNAGQADNVGEYWYDIELTDAGKPRTIRKARYIMAQDITK